MNRHEFLRIVEAPASGPGDPDSVLDAAAFDPARLIQARRLAGIDRPALAARAGVGPASVGEWETGARTPRTDQLHRLALTLEVPVAFFGVGRPHARLDTAMAHFRGRAAADANARAKAIATVEQVWELAQALQRRVRFPPVDLPVVAADRPHPSGARTPAACAAALRRQWALGSGPVPHLVRTIENHGLLIALTPVADDEMTNVDTFSVGQTPRPIILLTPNRASDVCRHRFAAAHELGHLLLHPNASAGDGAHERAADAFAAEFLVPLESISPQLPSRVDLDALDRLSRTWGVSIETLLHRCREAGIFTDPTHRGALLRLRDAHAEGRFVPEPTTEYPGEIPVVLQHAYALATDNGLTANALAGELAWPLPRVRRLLHQPDERPELRLVSHRQNVHGRNRRSGT